MSSGGDDLDEPAQPRAVAGPSPLSPGDHLGPIEYLRDRPEDLGHGYPMHLYELRDVAELQWANTPVYRYLVASDAIVASELPAWRFFGPHGEGVPEVLEGIWTLTAERVSDLVVPPGDRPWERIPIPLLEFPHDDRGASNAASTVMWWTESKSWSVGSGGGFFYRGCYMTYIVSDPQWLMAMGLARNAAVAMAAGPAISAAHRDAATAAWSELVAA